MKNLTDSPKLDLDISERTQRTNGYWSMQKPLLDRWAWADVFSQDECESIIHICSKRNMVSAETGSSGLSSYRKSNVLFLFPDATTEWIFYKLEEATNRLNDFFKFDLQGMGEGIQFAEYKAPDGHYNWHTDTGDTPIARKLSLTVELSDPSTYEGGYLELNATGEPQKMSKQQGRIIAFPSHTLHRVTPVTSGVRYSLVVWVTGPPFR